MILICKVVFCSILMSQENEMTDPFIKFASSKSNVERILNIPGFETDAGLTDE